MPLIILIATCSIYKNHGLMLIMNPSRQRDSTCLSNANRLQMCGLRSQISPPTTYTSLQRINCFLGITLSPPSPGAKFTIYKLYSPGRQHAICRLFHAFRSASVTLTPTTGCGMGTEPANTRNSSGLADNLVKRIVYLHWNSRTPQESITLSPQWLEPLNRGPHLHQRTAQ